jgi:hypothetical protein
MALNQANASTGETPADKCIRLDPDVVIVQGLSVNAAVLGVGGRTQAEMIADAASLYNYINTNLPNAIIIYSRLIPYDEERHSAVATSSLKRKYCVPILHGYSDTAGETSQWTSEYNVLDQTLTAGSIAKMDNWKALDSSIQGLAAVDYSIDTSYFRVGRLGWLSYDRVHPTEVGHQYILSRLYEEFRTNSSIQTDIPEVANINYIGDFTDFDLLWSSVVKLDAGGDGYVFDPDFLSGREYVLYANILNHNDLIKNFTYWANEMRPGIAVKPTVNRSSNDVFVVKMDDLWPDQDIYTKVWLQSDSEPSSWATSETTSSSGGHIGSDLNLTLASGSYYIKYKIGNDVFGPFEVVISGAYSFGGGGGSGEAQFIVEKFTDHSAGTGWQAVSMSTSVASLTQSDVTSAVKWDTNYYLDVFPLEGYTQYKVVGQSVINPSGNGVCVLSHANSGQTQFVGQAGNSLYNGAGGAAYYPLGFESKKWTDISSTGNRVWLTMNCPNLSTLVGTTFGILFGVKLR